MFIAEFERTVSPDETASFVALVDSDLMQRNLDYRDHRAGGFGLRCGGAGKMFVPAPNIVMEFVVVTLPACGFPLGFVELASITMLLKRI